LIEKKQLKTILKVSCWFYFLLLSRFSMEK